MGWKAAFLDNWPYKVAGLMLAALLWLSVSADRDRTEQAVTTTLQFDYPDQEWVAVDLPREARTTFRGRLSDILALPGQVSVRHSIPEIEDSVFTVELDPSMVRYDRRLAVQPVAIRPSRVEIRFQRLAEKRVPVAIDVAATPDPGFTILGDPIVQPESVRVRGAREEVDAISHVDTDPLDLGGLRESATRQLRVRPPAELSTLRFEPERVIATLRVDSLVERRLRATLRPVGPASGSVSLSPTEVEVILRGAASEVEGLTVGAMGVEVRVERVPEGEARLPVEVTLPDGVSATAVASPREVVVRPVEEEVEGPPGAEGEGGR